MTATRRGQAFPTLLLALSGTQMFMVAPGLHIAVVGVAGLLAVAASVTMSVIAMRRDDVHALWLGMGFSVMATLLVIHALATPGIVLPANGLVQLAGALNLPIGGAILAASGLSVLRRPRRIKLLLGLQLALIGELAIAGALVLVSAPVIPAVPAPSTLAANVIFALGASPLALLAWRAARTYLLTRRGADLIVAHGVVWLIGAQYGLLHFSMMQAGLWAAHILEVGGIGMVGIPAALDLRHAVGSRPLSGHLRASDLVEHEEAFLGGRVRAILLRLGEKDPSTEAATRGASRCWGWRSESASDSRRAVCASWPSAVCSMTWASCRCPTRSSTSPAGSLTRSSLRSAATPAPDASSSTSLAASPHWSSTSWSHITSASTAMATLTASPRASSTSPCGSSPSPTCTTRSPPTASTVRRGLQSALWRCSMARLVAPSIPSSSAPCVRS